MHAGYLGMKYNPKFVAYVAAQSDGHGGTQKCSRCNVVVKVAQSPMRLSRYK